MLLLRYPDLLVWRGIAGAHGARVIAVPREFALEIVQRPALEEIAATWLLPCAIDNKGRSLGGFAHSSTCIIREGGFKVSLVLSRTCRCVLREDSYLLLEDEDVAALGAAAILEAVQPGVDVQHAQVLGAHALRVLRLDNLVLVDVEAVEARLIITRRAPAAVPLLVRRDHGVRVRATENRDEDENGVPCSVKHHRSLTRHIHAHTRARARARARVPA